MLYIRRYQEIQNFPEVRGKSTGATRKRKLSGILVYKINTALYFVWNEDKLELIA